MMPIWLQHVLILLAVAGCIAYLTRGAYRALQGRKSRLGGCGVCTGCATTPAAPPKTSERVAMIPMDALARSARKRRVE